MSPLQRTCCPVGLRDPSILYVCMYVCMYGCMHVRMYTLQIHTYPGFRKFVYLHYYVSIYIYTQTCIPVYCCLNMYLNIYIYIYLHLHTYIRCRCIFMYVRPYKAIYNPYSPADNPPIPIAYNPFLNMNKSR